MKYLDATLSPEVRAEDRLSRMTLLRKINKIKQNAPNKSERFVLLFS